MPRLVLGIDVERCTNARKYSLPRIGDAAILGRAHDGALRLALA